MMQKWTSRLAGNLAALFTWPGTPFPPEPADRDADRRRASHDLEAIRVRFPDHA